MNLYLHIIPLLLLVGATGGFLSGLLGIGGGLIFVPALYYAFTGTGFGADAAIRVAVATSLSLVMITGATSAFWHHKKGSVDFSILKSWGPFIVLGVAAGTGLAAHVSGYWLKKIFAGTALLISLYMALSHEPEVHVEKPHRLPPSAQRAAAAFIGAIGAIIGIGGAILTIPLMAWIGVPMRRAVGTGGALGTAIAVPGVVGYIVSGLHHAGQPPFSLGYVNLLAAGIIAPFCFALSPVGVHVSHNMPRVRLRRIFAVLLVFVSIRMFTAS